MDRLIYVAMTGAREAMKAQATVAQNLANIGTNGFRGFRAEMESVPIEGAGLPSRVNATSVPGSTDFSPGTLVNTDRDLDVAVRGRGWLTVQGQEGQEGYTRAGNLRISATGLLELPTGELVMGNGGPISIPPHEALYIGGDGQISIIPEGQKADTMTDVDRIKLVNPPLEDLSRGPDGLFVLKEGKTATADPAVEIVNKHLETSNVNASQALIDMIELSRHYEMQVRAMHTADENDEAASRLMRLG